MPVAEPTKELRFTRAHQAIGFWIGAAVLVMAALVFMLLAPYRAENPELPSPLWGIIPLFLAWLSARIALRCTRKAYIILSPIGVEIFPFFRPTDNLQVIPWAQITAADIDDPPTLVTLHFNPEKTAGIHLSLTPIPKPRRPLLTRALQCRLEERQLP